MKEWQKKSNWCESNDIKKCCLTCKYANLQIYTTHDGELSARTYCMKHRRAKTMWNAVCDDWKKHKDN